MALYSLSKNTDSKYNYDIIVLHSDLTDSCIEKLDRSIVNRNNVSLRFFNVSNIYNYLSKERIFKRNHMTFAAYYRLFLSSILLNYEKVLYLDSDLLILKDVSELYNVELGNNLCAAVVDYAIAYMEFFRSDYNNITKYLNDVLGISDVKKYFNSGVLLLNLKSIRDENLEERLIEVARINDKYWHDQNVLNSVFKDRCLLLDQKWNYLWHVAPKENYSKIATDDLMKYEAAKRDPAIIHYATDKPYDNEKWEGSHPFWDYAFDTPFNHELLEKVFISSRNKADKRVEAIKKNNEALQKENKTLAEKNKTLFTDLQNTKNDNETLQKENKTLAEKNRSLQTNINTVSNSISYKVGRILTYIPRIIISLMR